MKAGSVVSSVLQNVSLKISFRCAPLSLRQVSLYKHTLYEKNLPLLVANSEWLQHLTRLTHLTKSMNGVNFRLQEGNRRLRGGYAFVKFLRTQNIAF
jgi:hypothetical protein